MAEEVILTILCEYHTICNKYQLEIPLWSWFILTIFEILKQFPAGITKTLLLTELDQRWRMYLKRGENSGKLQQIMSTRQITSTDILIGTLVQSDNHRWKFTSDGISVQTVIPRQFKNWINFFQNRLTSIHLDPATSISRDVNILMTKCNLMQSSSNPLLLLPSSLGVFSLTTSSDRDLLFLTSLLNSHHELLQLLTSTNEIKEIDDSKLNGVFVVVNEITDILDYPTRSAHCYRIIKCQIPASMDFLTIIPTSYVFSIHFILYNDQVNFGSLISKGDLLYLYRPYLEKNSAEEAIFGSKPADLNTTSHFESIPVVYRRGEHVGNFQSNHHFLYGSSSAILKVKQNQQPQLTKRNPEDIIPLKIPTLLENQHAQGLQLKDEKKRITLIGRILSVEENSMSQRRSHIHRSFSLIPSFLFHATPPEGRYLCRIQLYLESSDPILEGQFAQLSSGDLILLTDLELEYISISSSSQTGNPYPTLNLTASFSPFTIQSKSSNPILLIISRLMSICTSTSLFPPLTVNEVLNLPDHQRRGFLKVCGQIIIPTNASRKRDRTEMDGQHSPDDMKMMTVEVVDSVQHLESHGSIPSLKCQFHQHTISSFEISSLFNKINSFESKYFLMTLVGPNDPNDHLPQNLRNQEEEWLYRIQCFSDRR